MSYWEKLEPTPKQLNAIDGYNKAYGVSIIIKNKQEAFNLIGIFIPKQKLDFDDGFIRGTNIRYEIVNELIFNSHVENNLNRLKNVENINIKDGKSIITFGRTNNTQNVIEMLENNMGRLMTESSYSEYEDSLGYLSEEELNNERNINGKI